MTPKVAEAPIVLIHGIKGSHLAQTYDDSFDVIWSGVQHRFESILDLELDEMGEVERDPWDVISVMQVEKLAYGELLGRLRKRFRNVPVYIFRYDWRLDLLEIAKKLSQFLDLLERKTGQGRFRIVTHSMGGLILSAFLKRDLAKNLPRVQRAVMAAPPFWGSIESLRVLVAGETVGWGFNAPEVYRKVARTFPSVYQLVSGYPQAWEHPEPEADIWNIKYWQRRVRFDGRDEQIYTEKDQLMQRHLARAKQFHDHEMLNFDDDLSETDRDRFLVLYGTGEKTRTQLKVRPYNSARDVQYFFDFDFEDGMSDEGDGTVPVRSVLRYQKIYKIPIKRSDVKAWWPWLWDDTAKINLVDYHAMFLAIDKVQSLVCDWFENKTPEPSWAEPIQP